MGSENSRYFVGTGITIFGIALPYTGAPVPHIVGYIGILIGIVVMFWPTLIGVTGPRLHLPVWLYAIELQEAAYRSYERIEGTPLAAHSLIRSSDERLGWFIHSFIINKLRFYGKRSPSRITRLIPESDLSRLHPNNSKNELADLFLAPNLRFTNVAVSRRDLKKYWRNVLLPLAQGARED